MVEFPCNQSIARIKVEHPQVLDLKEISFDQYTKSIILSSENSTFHVFVRLRNKDFERVLYTFGIVGFRQSLTKFLNVLCPPLE